jgi:hypothetical protein
MKPAMKGPDLASLLTVDEDLGMRAFSLEQLVRSDEVGFRYRQKQLTLSNFHDKFVQNL